MKKNLFFLAAALTLALIATKPAPETNRAEVNQVQGFFIFTDSKPVSSYKYLGTTQSTGHFIGRSGAQYENTRDRLLNKLRKDFPNADGAILHLTNGTADKADAIKFE